MKPELMYYIIAVVGVLFHVVMKLRNAFTEAAPDAEISDILKAFKLKKQIIFAAFSCATALVLVWFRDYVFSAVGIDPKGIDPKLLNALVFFLGYFSDSIWKNTEKTGASKFKVEDKV